MNADEFVERLRAIVPPIVELLASGQTREEAETFRRSVVPEWRPGMTERVERNPILDLMCRCNLTAVGLGVVTFLESPVRSPGRIVFGKAEADWLVIDETTGVVKLVDHANQDYTICECAASSSSFLDALIAGMENKAPDSEGENMSVVDYCSFLAGGDKYREFYAQILGWDLDDVWN